MSSSWDQRAFDEALTMYMKVTKRTVVDVVNTKLFFIARKATLFTHHARASQIQAELGRLVTVRATTRTGRTVRRRELELTPSRDHAAPLAALIVQKRRREAGQPGLTGSELESAIRTMIAARLRSVRFLKVGWLWPIRFLEKFAKFKSEGSGQDREARQYGQPKGRAIAATEANGQIGMMENFANAKNDDDNALQRFGEPGLQRAFDEEQASMIQYIEQKMAEPTAAANARLK